MGYDMTIIEEIPHEAEGMIAPKRKLQEVNALLKQLREEGHVGSVLTPEHEALPEEERKALRDAVHNRAAELVNEESISFDIALLKAREVPASQQYLDALQCRSAAWDEIDRANLSYFRLNIWGMGHAREIMNRLGMLKSTTESEWPETDLDSNKVQALMGLDDDRGNPLDLDQLKSALAEAKTSDEADSKIWTEYFGDLTFSDADLESYIAFREAMQKYRSAHDESVPGIEAGKFCSNDGWIVTPAECSSVVEIWSNLDDGQRKAILEESPWFQGWMEFIERAIAYGGFQVW